MRRTLARRSPLQTAHGRTPHFRIVHADGPADLVGQTVPVEILGSGANSLTGRILAQG